MWTMQYLALLSAILGSILIGFLRNWLYIKSTISIFLKLIIIKAILGLLVENQLNYLL